MQNAQYIAQRKINKTARHSTEFTNIEVKNKRVRGIEHTAQGETQFNVKLQAGDKFYKGSGSSKIAYYLKQIQQ